MTTRSFNASLKGFGVAPTAATVVVEKLTHGLAGKSFHLPRRAHCTSCGRELDLEGDPGVGYQLGDSPPVSF